jgi:hypothetical protein
LGRTRAPSVDPPGFDDDNGEYDISGLRIGEYPLVTDESVGIEESADSGERHSRVQAFGPGTDFGHGEY